MTQTPHREELNRLLNPIHPLPGDNDWAIADDFALMIARHVLDHRPKAVMELGSGLSTLVLGYALKKNGSGRLISIEHDADWLEKCRDDLEKHELSEVVELLYSPLVPCEKVPDQLRWYSIPGSEEKVDFLVIDGPPGTLALQARYPALPVLWDRLSDNAVIMLDDAWREGEKKIVERWMSAYPLRQEFIYNAKGTAILRRSAI